MKKVPGSSVLLTSNCSVRFVYVSYYVLKTFYITGKGDVSFLRNVKALQTEYKKMRHNPQIIDELMVSTFPNTEKI